MTSHTCYLSGVINAVAVAEGSEKADHCFWRCFLCLHSYACLECTGGTMLWRPGQWLPLPQTGMTQAEKGAGGEQAALAQMASTKNWCLPRRKALTFRCTWVSAARAAYHPPSSYTDKLTRGDLIRKSLEIWCDWENDAIVTDISANYHSIYLKIYHWMRIHGKDLTSYLHNL